MKQLIIILFLCCSASLAQAQNIYIDSIIATVEDDVITNTELAREVTRIRQEYSKKGRPLAASNSLNAQILELMINKSILLQEAKRRGITITDTQLNDTMQNLAKRNNKTLAQFRQALLGQNIDYKQFREDVKNELIINSIKARYARQNSEITDQEVDDFIIRNGADTNSLEYRLSHILIALPDAASTEQVSEARKTADELIIQLKNGADFTRLATQHSAGSNAIEGGDLGWRKLAEIPSLFSSIVPNMEIGQVSDVIRSASGFHIVKLNDIRDSEQLIVEQTHARHILITPNKLLNSEQARKKLEKIRDQIIQGADFAELAKKYSDDPGSKGLGGDLGWFSKGRMVPEFDKVLETATIGETSKIFETKFGWHILQLLGKRVVDETDESKRKKIREQLQAQKEREVLELWQRRLRDQAFVKIHTGS